LIEKIEIFLLKQKPVFDATALYWWVFQNIYWLGLKIEMASYYKKWCPNIWKKNDFYFIILFNDWL